MPPTASTRWSPTPEQLMILEELYRREIKTPTASQIQHITSHLSLYGKIEGKNVFYWFQNHKARDRQKLRRKLLRQQQQQQQPHLQQHQIQHHGLFHYIQSPPFTANTAPALLQLPPLYNQTQFLPQGGESSNQMMIGDYGCNIIDSSSEKVEMENPNNPMYSQDWMMMMMMMDTTNTPCCTRLQPPKTLQLFPITTKEALPDDCIASSTH